MSTVKTIGKHINNALREELDGQVVVANFATTTKHGAVEGKTQTHMVEFYNLDVIISVGYRVKSKRGVEFRRWANSVLKQRTFCISLGNDDYRDYELLVVEERGIDFLTSLSSIFSKKRLPNRPSCAKI